ncbi:MAG: FoF1 ATP synthase subunit gamma [Lachnospiraceae bacterium]
MNIKTIVKVMNFHAILRVDRARRDAEQYDMLEREAARMIDVIQNNRNFIIDKWILEAKENAPRLRFYISSDLGFCGAINASINTMLQNEVEENDVILIGKKAHTSRMVDLIVSREDFEEKFYQIEEIISDAVKLRKYSGIDICYNHYHNISSIEPVIKTIFPVHIDENAEETYTEDFTVEGADIDTLMERLLTTYLCYEVKSAAVSSFASENIQRQNATTESLKKIDEIEQEELWNARKVANAKAAKKVIDSYVKSKRSE